MKLNLPLQFVLLVIFMIGSLPGCSQSDSQSVSTNQPVQTSKACNQSHDRPTARHNRLPMKKSCLSGPC